MSPVLPECKDVSRRGREGSCCVGVSIQGVQDGGWSRILSKKNLVVLRVSRAAAWL
jgi:hypothetical protein